MSRLFDLLQGIITKLNSIKGGSANWNQNDQNGDGYVENRTHYIERTDSRDLIYQDVDLNKYGQYGSSSGFTEVAGEALSVSKGDTLLLNLQTVDYGEYGYTEIFAQNEMCTVYQAPDDIDVFMDDRTANRLYVKADDLLVFLPSDQFPNYLIGPDPVPIEDWSYPNTVNVRLQTVGTCVYHKLDENFLPDTVARISDLPITDDEITTLMSELEGTTTTEGTEE